jgi:phosphoglycolate phosphatase-like HAD superfamily hydrolase
MSDPVQKLVDFQPQNEFFVGIDSDGCVFDSMEIKHKECFAPMFIKHFGLQAASKYARECWEFVNLYSRMRGINRFPALSNALNLLRSRPEVIARQVLVPETDALDDWISRESKLGNASLEAEVKGGNERLQGLLEWSNAVNDTVEDIVHGVPPFPLVRETMAKLSSVADVLCISQTPIAALEREWGEHALSGYVQLIAGQEMGTKTQHIKIAAADKYPSHRILMIGDAPGDFKAAKSNGALFYPITPGEEERSWQRLFEEALQVFFDEKYAGSYEEALLSEFNASLPSDPSWSV